MRAVTRLAGCLLVAVLTTGAFGAPAGAAVRRADTITITGEAHGLYPGATVTLIAEVTNPFPFAVRMTSVDGTPVDGGGCPASMLTVTGSSADVVVEPGATESVSLQAYLDRNAGHVCQSATFTIAFAGTAVEAIAGSSALPTTGGSVAVPLATAGTLIALGLVAIRRTRRAAR